MAEPGQAPPELLAQRVLEHAAIERVELDQGVTQVFVALAREAQALFERGSVDDPALREQMPEWLDGLGGAHLGDPSRPPPPARSCR